MKVNVTDQGLIIPKEFLVGITSVEVRREEDQIILTPVLEDDPIWGLGSDPIELGISDAAENHDQYLYGLV
jgi:virulence-associated protein VagC